MLVFRKILRTYLMDGKYMLPSINTLIRLILVAFKYIYQILTQLQRDQIILCAVKNKLNEKNC